MITSKTNQQLKNIKKLLSSSGERKKSGLFVIEGVRIVREAPENLVEAVFVSEEYQGQVPSSAACQVVERKIFRELSDTVTPQGILAVIRRPDWKLRADEYLQEENPSGRVLLLDGIRDPGNLGTMVRTAEAAGVRIIFMSPDCVDLYNPKVIRSTMGSIFRVPAVVSDLESVIGRMKKQGTCVYGTSLSAERSFRDADLSDAGIVIGSEASGVSEKVLSAASELIRIPMEGKVESLNAAVSAAILMFC
ncbi:MAG: RNA methyltransferase [Parasporobacterium sp.]|nr:RNA methyltransferase [Parasporobacterium sp.]